MTWVYFIIVTIVCQCPKRANFISTRLLFRTTWPQMSVNALNGLTSFLRNALIYGNAQVYGCQCPKRANFISTVPSGNPCKYWLSSLIFAGICFLYVHNLFIFQTSILPISSNSLYPKIKDLETLFLVSLIIRLHACIEIIMSSLLFSDTIKPDKPKRQIPYDQYHVHHGKPSGKRGSRNCIKNKESKN